MQVLCRGVVLRDPRARNEADVLISGAYQVPAVGAVLWLMLHGYDVVVTGGAAVVGIAGPARHSRSLAHPLGPFGASTIIERF